MTLLWFNWIGLLRVCQMYSKALCLPEVSSVCSLQGIYLTFQNLFCLVTVVQSLQSTLCHPMDCSTSSFFVLHYLLEFAQTHVHWISDIIQTSHSLSPLLLLPSDLPSIRVFPNELALPIRRPKYWNFIFSISPSIGYPGVISFRITNHNLRNLILLGLSVQCCVPGSWNEWHLRSQQEWPQSAQSFLVT